MVAFSKGPGVLELHGVPLMDDGSGAGDLSTCSRAVTWLLTDHSDTGLGVPYRSVSAAVPRLDYLG